MIRPGTAQARRTLIVEDIPPEGRTAEGVSAFIDTLFGPNSVYCCHVQANTSMAYHFKMVGMSMQWAPDEWPNATTATVITTTQNPAYTDNSIGTVLFAWSLNSLLLVSAVAAFEILLHWGPARNFLAPRLNEDNEGSSPPQGPKHSPCSPT